MNTDRNKITQKHIDKMVITQIKRRFQSARTQARFVGHEWHITIDEFMELWLEDDRWLRSGRTSDCLAFSRIDMEKDWTIDNVHIITRKEMLKNQGRYIKIAKTKLNNKKRP